MEGTGLPLVTPFDETGEIDEPALSDLVDRVTDAGVDFVVPCGSNSEAPLLTATERRRVVEVVADRSDVPVLAGTGQPGYRETLADTEAAAAAGADAALVVTPYYFRHDQAALASYYRGLADESPIPIFLYSVPKYTETPLDPRTVEALSTHPNVGGIKDSSGNLERLQRTVSLTGDADFSVLVGSGSIYAAGLDHGADGGVLALANVVPELASEIYDRHTDGDTDGARDLNRSLVELNRAVTARYGIPGLKAAMRSRSLPAGHVRRPFQPVDDATTTELAELVRAAR
ncbi:dihydrodipicolinate synthase family protein [Haloarchaeobius salinus]|uniref:dihydrodipicolinate synthase family protein n=1 Tax=Haloarchaeobius salinus TaxID=1198298 RepID=UPI0021086CB2|nr:dihydrodipicolinate synthase family protein [Haloarchaeobius salinus]